MESSTGESPASRSRKGASHAGSIPDMEPKNGRSAARYYRAAWGILPTQDGAGAGPDAIFALTNSDSPTLLLRKEHSLDSRRLRFQCHRSCRPSRNTFALRPARNHLSHTRNKGTSIKVETGRISTAPSIPPAREPNVRRHLQAAASAPGPAAVGAPAQGAPAPPAVPARPRPGPGGAHAGLGLGQPAGHCRRRAVAAA